MRALAALALSAAAVLSLVPYAIEAFGQEPKLDVLQTWNTEGSATFHGTDIPWASSSNSQLYSTSRLTTWPDYSKSNIMFMAGSPGGVPILELKADGRIMVKGREAATDQALVDALREFLTVGCGPRVVVK